MYRVTRNGHLYYRYDHEITAVRAAANLAASSQPGEWVKVEVAGQDEPLVSFPGSSHTFGECGVMAALTAAVAVCVGMVEAFTR